MMNPASRPPEGLALRLFGPFQATIDGAPLGPLRSVKGGWLLALLALRAGREVDRAWLAGTLWGDSTERQALGNLRRTLTDLRAALGAEAARLASPTPGTLRLDLVGAKVDLVEFDVALRGGEDSALERAVAVCSGPLLEGCVEEWVAGERVAREEALLCALERLAEAAIRRGAWAAGIGHLRRAVAADPLRESARRLLMHALAESGNDSAAVLAYRELRILLHREMNAEPDPETTDLFRRLQEKGRRSDRPRRAVRRSGGPAPFVGFPTAWTPLIGRDAERREVRAMVATWRLVTLTGPGGVGKTRLAVRVAGEIAPEFADGAWFVDLSGLADPALAPDSIADALEAAAPRDAAPLDSVRGPGAVPPAARGRSAMRRLKEALRDRSLLLVLDNFEHILGAAAVVSELLAAAPGVRALVTSRAVLGLSGERSYAVPPLSLPARRVRPGIRDGLGSDAVRLFVDRATAARSEFALSEENRAAVAALCRRLDGLPLAIELAAARIRVLTPESMLAHLNGGLDLLAVGAVDGPDRHRTLREAMAWSYDLLTEPERILFRRLSIFSGAFSLDAAHDVAGPDGPGETRDPIALIDRLDALIRQSFVARDPSGSENRYAMLETVREFGRERLAETEEAAAVRGRHAGYYVRLAASCEPALHGPEQVESLDRLDRDRANLQEALAWCLEGRGDLGAGLSLAWSLRTYWRIRGGDPEERRWLAAAARRTECAEAARHRACVIQWAARVYTGPEDDARAERFWREQLGSARESGDAKWEAYLSTGLGRLAARRGDRAEALRNHETALERYRAAGDRAGAASALFDLGDLARHAGRFDDAIRWLDECHTHHVELADRARIARSLHGLARVAIARRDALRAFALLLSALRSALEIGYSEMVAMALEGVAACALACGEPARAARLIGSAEATRSEIGVAVPDADREEYDACVDTVRRELGDAGFAAEWTRGQALAPERAVDLAVRPLVRSEGLAARRAAAGVRSASV